MGTILRTVFQTLQNRNNINQVELNGPYKCTKPDAWLGQGYYFWDNDITFAHFWGKRTYKNIGYYICTCHLDASNILDLYDNPSDKEFFLTLYNKTKEKLNHGSSNAFSLSRFVRIMQDENNTEFFPYNGIRAMHVPRRKPDYIPEIPFNENKSELITIHHLVQICIFDISSVSLQLITVSVHL